MAAVVGGGGSGGWWWVVVVVVVVESGAAAVVVVSGAAAVVWSHCMRHNHGVGVLENVVMARGKVVGLGLLLRDAHVPTLRWRTLGPFTTGSSTVLLRWSAPRARPKKPLVTRD